MTAYIWDLDGTLLDSYGVIVEGAARTAAEAGLRDTPEDVLKGTVKDLVSQSYLVTANGDSVIAKDMDTEITERYTFEHDGSVSVTEVKVAKTEEDEEDQEWE